MTDVYAPPPPPPPPPPARPDSATFDFIRPFAFVFEDPQWLPKVLIGGLFVLASVVLIGVFFLFGYIAKLVRNVIAGVQHPLPDWDDLGAYFTEGLMLFVVTLIYSAPVVLLVLIVAIPGAIMSNADNEGMRNLGSGVVGCAWCVVAPLSLALWLFVPGALLMVITSGRFGAAFDFGRIWTFIRANIGNYLLAVVVYLVARFAAGFGVILLCIGIIFTEFWAMTIAGYAFGEVYRLSQRR